MGRIYRTLAWLFRRLGKMETVWTEPFVAEPCVFVCNHVGALGPIDMVSRFPLWDQVYAWCNEGIMNKASCPAYVRQDYWWQPGCKLEKFYDAILPSLASLILPPVLQSAPTIPVYHDARVMTTMRQSLKVLKEGKYLVIFPEQPSGFGTHHDWINTGWLNLCTLYYRSTGGALRLYPVHIDPKKHRFTVARPVQFDTTRSLAEQEAELAEVLKKGLRGE